MADGTVNISPVATPASPASPSPPTQTAPASATDLRAQSGHEQTEASAVPETATLTAEEMRDFAEGFVEVVSIINQGIRLEIDDSTGELITKVINKETNEVIRQIPPEELLAIARRMRDFVGLLLDVEI